jgi:ribosomal protein S6--L-glutamate ligase
MRIAILSREPRSYSVRRLKEAAAAAGHTTRVMDTMRFGVLLEHEEPDLLYMGKRVRPYDAVIPRLGPSITYFGSTVVRQFDHLGAFCLNPGFAINHARDKLRSLQMLSRHGLPIPDTAFVRDRKDVLDAIERVGGAPVIIKLLEGSQGVGVILAETQKVAEAILETLQSAKQNVLVQKFVAESKGRDIRAFVVGDQVVGAMRRKAEKSDEFRSNIHRGGSAEALELDLEYERVAVRSAHVMGLRVAGVDMLESAEGPQIMEVNASPGLEGIEAATKVDVAGAIITYLERRVGVPDVDVRYRLGLARGFGVAELPVVDNAVLDSKRLDETHLRDDDVIVLSITRGRDIISSPRGDTRIESGDVLLCYGPLETIRALLPARKRKPTRKKSTPTTNKPS